MNGEIESGRGENEVLNSDRYITFVVHAREESFLNSFQDIWKRVKNYIPEIIVGIILMIIGWTSKMLWDKRKAKN